MILQQKIPFNLLKPGTCFTLVIWKPYSAIFKHAQITKAIVYTNRKVGPQNYMKNNVNIVKASSSARSCWMKLKERYLIVSEFIRAPAKYDQSASDLFMGKVKIKIK